MIGWKRLYPKPAGSLPGGIVTQWGVALITVLILVFVAIWLCHGRIVASGNRLHRGRSHRPVPELRRADGRAGRSRVPTGRDAPDGGGSDPTGAAAPGGAREVATGAIGGGQVTMDEALLLAGPSPETGRAYTQQEFELRERLRLEALERRSRSLRSSPVAQTYRQLDRARSPAEADAEPGPVEAIRAEGSGGAFSGPWDVPGCDGQPGR